MEDNIVPNSNFQPYQPAGVTPHAEDPERWAAGSARKTGVDPERFRNFKERVGSMNGRDWLAQLKSFARSRPAMILTGIAVAVIGARLIRRRVK